MAAVTTTSLPPLRTEAERERQLVVMRRRATGLLGLVAIAYVALLLFTTDDGWAAWARAMAEASLVGGLADWFAVTALFRYPLGIPVPHTAVIPERKDQFGETLGEFVQRSFLTPEIIVERVRAAEPAHRLGHWLSLPVNAERVSRHVVDAMVAVTDMVDDDEIHRLIEQTVRSRLETVPLAPTAGKVLRVVTAERRHHVVLDSMFRAVERFIAESREQLRASFAKEIPRWIPNAVEDRIFDRVVDGVGNAIREVIADPDHELRNRFDEWVAEQIDALETSPELLARGEELKRELLEHPRLREWTTQVWSDLKQQLRAQAGDPSSQLRRRIADTAQSVGARLVADEALATRVDDGIETGVRFVAGRFSGEISKLVSATIARWDGAETARRLELLLGPDLQFIRINGTVVGALAGLLIHAVSQFS